MSTAVSAEETPSSRSGGLITEWLSPIGELVASRVNGLRDRLAGDESFRLRLAKRFEWIRNIGGIVLLFAGWQLWGTGIGEHHAQSVLERQFHAMVAANGASIPVASRASAPVSTNQFNPGTQLMPADAPVPQPAEGSVMAEIEIPSIGVRQFVVEGTAEDDLAKGPGHYIGTALPGQAGNLAIAGHRTTYGAPFERLDELSAGDPIYVTTTSGSRITYTVTGTPSALLPSQVSVLDNSGDSRLTLTTCTPKFSAVQRLVAVATFTSVQASLGTSETQGAAAPQVVSSRSGGPSRAAALATGVLSRPSGLFGQVVREPGQVARGLQGWDLALLPFLLLVFGALVLLGLANGPLALHLTALGSWLILAPVWVGGLYGLFDLLQRVLPPSL